MSFYFPESLLPSFFLSFHQNVFLLVCLLSNHPFKTMLPFHFSFQPSTFLPYTYPFIIYFFPLQPSFISFLLPCFHFLPPLHLSLIIYLFPYSLALFSSFFPFLPRILNLSDPKKNPLVNWRFPIAWRLFRC